MTWRARDLTLFAFLMLSAAGTRSLPPQDEIDWLDSYPEALREAKRTNKPIFLEFRCEA